MWQYNYAPDYICHWGVKGQKWGVRRYQNRDGSLTPAGKKRYQKSEKKTSSTFKSRAADILKTGKIFVDKIIEQNGKKSMNALSRQDRYSEYFWGSYVPREMHMQHLRNVHNFDMSNMHNMHIQSMHHF